MRIIQHFSVHSHLCYLLDSPDCTSCGLEEARYFRSYVYWLPLSQQIYSFVSSPIENCLPSMQNFVSFLSKTRFQNYHFFHIIIKFTHLNNSDMKSLSLSPYYIEMLA